MNAVRIHRRGGLEFLKSEDAPIPQLVADDVLVRAHRTAQFESRERIEAVRKTMNDHER